MSIEVDRGISVIIRTVLNVAWIIKIRNGCELWSITIIFIIIIVIIIIFIMIIVISSYLLLFDCCEP
jgi:uncharacterized BrkB/YihY/UPF0761 family membrane protein